MKKLISCLLLFTILFGMLSSFSFAVEVDTPYSGGSGTEEDPYLISNASDIKEIYENIETDPSLYTRKVYYKLTADITVNHKISPLYVSDNIGPNCFIKTEYGLSSFPWGYDKSSMSYVETGEPGENLSDVVAKIGPLQIMKTYIDDPPRELWGPSVSNVYLSVKITSFTQYIESLFWTGFEDQGSDYERYHDIYHRNFYRSAAFTGVFDGDGHTVTIGSCKFLFGYLENGAEIKNMNIKASEGSLAYSIGSTCSVINCSFDSASPSSVTYLYKEYMTWAGESSDRVGIYKEYDTVSGFVVKNYGNYYDCVNYGDFTYENKLNATMTNFIDYSGTIDASNENVYSKDECIEAEGDHTAFEGLDFENFWVMKDGLPVLRLNLETVMGDLNLDGAVNSIDSCLVKRYLAGAGVSIEYVNLKAADMDKDNTVNALDSALLKLTLVGK